MNIRTPDPRPSVRRVSARTLSITMGVGLLGALVTGSLLIAFAPVVAVLVVRMLRFAPVERILVGSVGVSVLLEHPSEIPYMRKWTAPWAALDRLWFEPMSHTVPHVPIPFAPMLVVSGILLVRALAARPLHPGRYVRLYLQASAVATLALVAGQAYGIARGGDARQTFYQLSTLLATFALGGTVALIGSASLLHTVERTLLIAAAARAFVALYVYLTVFRPADQSYLYVTTHSDSVLWVVAVLLVAGRMISTFGRDRLRGRLALLLLLLAAIVANNRRIAFVELALGGMYALWAVPPRLRGLRGRVLVVGAPLLLVYTLAALAAPPSRIFLPVQSLVTVNSEDDSSTLSRDIENYNLAQTIRESSPLGTGFGHEYDEQVAGPDISVAFPQYRYLPHNSTLGLLAFGGVFGFAAVWMPFVIGMGGVVRVRHHRSPAVGAAGFWMAGAVIAHAMMAWGDIGLQSMLNGLLVALACGFGVRFADDPVVDHLTARAGVVDGAALDVRAEPGLTVTP